MSKPHWLSDFQVRFLNSVKEREGFVRFGINPFEPLGTPEEIASLKPICRSVLVEFTQGRTLFLRLGVKHLVSERMFTRDEIEHIHRRSLGG